VTRAMQSAPLVVALLAVSALGVARTQPRLARVAREVKEKDDVYALPPPAQLRALTFGYDAAAVDLLWAKLLVAYGTHWHEKRDFHPDPYLDTILMLDPTYLPVYRFADTLLCYRPMHGTEADARKARAILELGTRERPADFLVWQEFGQFSAFLGPGFLPNDENDEKARWREEGARALSKAAALGADDSLGLVAAGMFERSGERDAQIKALRRSYSLTDDPDQQAIIVSKLARLEASATNEAAEHAKHIIESRWRRDAAFLTRGEFLLLDPSPDPARCAGPAAADDEACTRDWDLVVGATRAP
jgi:hypothetical protein